MTKLVFPSFGVASSVFYFLIANFLSSFLFGLCLVKVVAKIQSLTINSWCNRAGKKELQRKDSSHDEDDKRCSHEEATASGSLNEDSLMVQTSMCEYPVWILTARSL